jgi:hypothetical protein
MPQHLDAVYFTTCSASSLAETQLIISMPDDSLCAVIGRNTVIIVKMLDDSLCAVIGRNTVIIVKMLDDSLCAVIGCYSAAMICSAEWPAPCSALYDCCNAARLALRCDWSILLRGVLSLRGVACSVLRAV